MRTQVTIRELAKASWPLMLLALCVNGLIVAVALQWVNVPGDLSASLDFPMLLAASIFPVIGTAIGFLFSFRKLTAASVPVLIGIGAAITAIFVVVAILDYTGEDGHGNTGVLVSVLLVTIAPPLVATIGLLRQRARLIGDVAAAPAAFNVPGLGPPAAGVLPPLVGAPAIPPLGQGIPPLGQGIPPLGQGIPPLGHSQPQHQEPQPDLGHARRTGVWQRPELPRSERG